MSAAPDPREQLVAHVLRELVDNSTLPFESKWDLVAALMTYHKSIIAERFMKIARESVSIAPDVRTAYRALEGLTRRINEHEVKSYDRLDNLLELLPDEMDRPAIERPAPIPTGGAYSSRPLWDKGGG